MILRKYLGPMDLFGIQTFYIYETIKILMICKKKYLMLAFFQVMILVCFKSFDNSQKFVIIGFILNFYRNYFPRNKSY